MYIDKFKRKIRLKSFWKQKDLYKMFIYQKNIILYPEICISILFLFSTTKFKIKIITPPPSLKPFYIPVGKVWIVEA